MGFCEQFWGKGKDIWWEPPRNATTADLRIFRHLWSRSDAPCSSILCGYSHLPQAKIWASLGSTAPLPDLRLSHVTPGLQAGHRKVLFRRFVCFTVTTVALTLLTQQKTGPPRFVYAQWKPRLLLPLSCTGNGTVGQIIHHLLLVELFDVEYYRDLEMWVKGCDVPIDLTQCCCEFVLLIYCGLTYMFNFSFWSILDRFFCCS